MVNEKHSKHRIAVYRAAIEAEENGHRTVVNTGSERPKNHDDLVVYADDKPPRAVKISPAK